MADQQKRSATHRARCKAYQQYGMFSKNKKAKMLRHAKRNPNDLVAQGMVKHIDKAVFTPTRKPAGERTHGKGREFKEFLHMARLAGLKLTPAYVRMLAERKRATYEDLVKPVYH